jgi:hypothetical protein
MGLCKLSEEDDMDWQVQLFIPMSYFPRFPGWEEASDKRADPVKERKKRSYVFFCTSEWNVAHVSEILLHVRKDANTRILCYAVTPTAFLKF